MTAGLGYWASNEFFDQTTASRKFRHPFARSMTASVQQSFVRGLRVVRRCDLIVCASLTKPNAAFMGLPSE